MGGPVHNKAEQMKYLQGRFEMLMTVLDSIDAEVAGVDEIDRLLKMLDDIETKCKQFRYDWAE
nr:SE1561 family protein [Bacillus solitudinis]